MAEDAEFEAEMNAISTVYSLRAGKTLTLQDYEAIQAFDGVSRRDQERATDAFHRGYEQGLTEGGGAEIADLKKRISELATNLAAERALKMFAQKDIDRLRAAMVEWHKPADKLPAENQECILMAFGGGVAGPVPWKGSCWIDLFATYEAGVAYSTDIVMLWSDWDAIKPPDKMIEALENAST